jgi:hypothetical protein
MNCPGLTVQKCPGFLRGSQQSEAYEGNRDLIVTYAGIQLSVVLSSLDQQSMPAISTVAP